MGKASCMVNSTVALFSQQVQRPSPTIPAVAIVSLVTGWTLVLGLDVKGMTLLVLTLIVATLSLGTGRTTVLQGAVHLVIFTVYLFTTVVP